MKKKKIFPGIVPKKKLLSWKIKSCQVSRFTQKGKKAARFGVQIKEVVPIFFDCYSVILSEIGDNLGDGGGAGGGGGGRSPIIIWSKKKNLSSQPVKKKKDFFYRCTKKKLIAA